MVVADLRNLRHFLHSHMARTHKGVAVKVRPARRCRIIVVDQLQELLVVGCNTLDVVNRAVAACKDVAAVNTDPQPLILKAQYELDKLRVGLERLRALACRRLQKNRTR